MQYRFAGRGDYSYLASGNVLKHFTGMLCFPVRLTLELFGRAKEAVGRDRLRVYDPCAGSGFSLSAMGIAMQREIGKHPVLAFGNSSGDFAMANYALNNDKYAGQAYMLLCDNTALDYGDVQTAESFAAKCAEAGYHTISMAGDFTTIYGDQVQKAEPAEDTLPAAA